MPLQALVISPTQGRAKKKWNAKGDQHLAGADISLQMGRLITVHWSPAKEVDPHIQRLANVGMAPMP